MSSERADQPAAPDNQPPVHGVPGQALAAQREAMGWSVEQVADQLKLAVRQVIALEAGDYAALPSPAVTRGFVRAYAKLVKLDNKNANLLDGLDPALLEGRGSLQLELSRSRLMEAAADLGARFILAEGVMHVRQPETAVAAARAALPDEAWPAGALHVVTTITGSALLALALRHRLLDEAQVWAAAHVDEDWNAEKWGADEEVQARRAQRQKDFEAAALVLKAFA